MTALIVDDEPLARAYLRRLLEAQGIEVIGEADNAIAALDQTEALHPDLLFLDIQMPVLNGMQMAGALLHLEQAPLVIFVTGYSEHAATAFERDALDYLLKPVTAERLAKTLLRARERLADREVRHRLTEHIDRQTAATPPLKRLPVRGDYAVRLVRVEDIHSAVSRDKRVFLCTPSGEMRTYYSLIQLEQMLPTDRFFRIHDSVIVDLERVEEILFLGNHAYEVRLTDNIRFPVGRSRYAELQRRLGLSPQNAG